MIKPIIAFLCIILLTTAAEAQNETVVDDIPEMGNTTGNETAREHHNVDLGLAVAIALIGAILIIFLIMIYHTRRK